MGHPKSFSKTNKPSRMEGECLGYILERKKYKKQHSTFWKLWKFLEIPSQTGQFVSSMTVGPLKPLQEHPNKLIYIKQLMNYTRSISRTLLVIVIMSLAYYTFTIYLLSIPRVVLLAADPQRSHLTALHACSGVIKQVGNFSDIF